MQPLINAYLIKYGYSTLRTMIDDHFTAHPSEDILVKEILANMNELYLALREISDQTR